MLYVVNVLSNSYQKVFQDSNNYASGASKYDLDYVEMNGVKFLRNTLYSIDTVLQSFGIIQIPSVHGRGNQPESWKH